jgi:hypothetical protein
VLCILKQAQAAGMATNFFCRHILQMAFAVWPFLSFESLPLLRWALLLFVVPQTSSGFET